MALNGEGRSVTAPASSLNRIHELPQRSRRRTIAVVTESATDYWRSMDRAQAVRQLMREEALDEVEAEFILAILLGEIEGDAVLLVQE